ncbi:MAG: peptidylprolyl isomerase [Gammaproteobacteria bacterium]
MNLRRITSGLKMTAVLCITLASSWSSYATIVEFQTSLGNFEVNLSDNSTPLTVANFLEYVNSGRYTNSIIHRSSPGFVVQGGGFTFDQAIPLDEVPAFPPVDNEPEFTSSRGTIAMAKIGGDPNSATSQWFFNLDDNASILDDQNGGFTVFGQVVGNGMDVVDAIAALPVFAFASPLNELPLRNFTATDFTAGTLIDETKLVMINAVVITDSTVDTSAGLSLSPNTVPPAPVTPPTVLTGDGGGGGGLGLVSLIAALFAYAVRRLGPRRV